MCDYKLKDGEKCKEEALSGSKYCILHIDFLGNRNSKEFERIAKLKEEKVKEKISKGDFNFEGAKLLNINFSGLKIDNDVNFTNAVVLEDVIFNNANIIGNVLFSGAAIDGDTVFDKAKIGTTVMFDKAKIHGGASFDGSVIDGSAVFDGAVIGRDISFSRATISGNILFSGAVIDGDTVFSETNIHRDVSFDGAVMDGYAVFDGAEIGGNISFSRATIGGNILFSGAVIEGNAVFDKAKIGLTVAAFHENKVGRYAGFTALNIKGKLLFRDTIFKKPETEEEAFKVAVRILERLGDREGADYHFYREMVARRKQKKWIIRISEWLLADATCQYGSNFIRPVAIWFLLVIVVFPVIYYFGHGIASPNPFFPFFKGAAESVKSFLSAEYFSIVTATTLGYGDLQPALTTIYHIPIFRVLAGLEAIFGTFMWVIFLTVFARKYMR